jgi:hypothetical protein
MTGHDDDRDPPSTTPVARLRGPADLIAAVPHMIGYHPSESFVGVSLRGERDRIGLTLCGPLPAPPAVRGQARDFAARMRHDGAERVLLLLFSAEPDVAGRLPHRPFVHAVRRQAGERGLPLADALLVRDGRRWSYLCRNLECCPPEGRVLAEEVTSPAVSLLAAEEVVAGRRPLSSRGALVASLAPPRREAARSMRVALDRAAQALVHPLPGQDGPGARQAALTTWRATVDRYDADPRQSLGPEEAARLLLGLRDVRVRDEVATWSLDGDAGLRALLGDLCRMAPPPDDAPVCTLLAWVCYGAGDGATANVALDRALASAPDYSMAVLLRRMLDAQVHAQQVRRAMADTRRELADHTARRRARPDATASRPPSAEPR